MTILKLVTFLGVLGIIWLATYIVEHATTISQEFWLECICISHIALNVSKEIIHA